MAMKIREQACDSNYRVIKVQIQLRRVRQINTATAAAEPQPFHDDRGQAGVQ
jgi:hypothetical protein